MLPICNPTIGLAVGVGLSLVARLLKKFANGERIRPEGFALAFAVLGAVLIVLGTNISVTLHDKTLRTNVMVGNLAFAFGVLLAGAAFFLWRERATFKNLGDVNEKSETAITFIVTVMRPVSVWIFALGLMLTAFTISTWHRQFTNNAAQSRISCPFDHSWTETSSLDLLWGLVALGAVTFPLSLALGNRKVLVFAATCWNVAGVLLVLFSAIRCFYPAGAPPTPS